MRAPEASEGRSEGAVILGQRAPAGSNSDCTNEALLRFNLGFVNQHDGNIIFNGVDSPALAALQPLPVAGELHRAFAQGTNQNIQQFLAYGHGSTPSSPSSWNLSEPYGKFKRRLDVDASKSMTLTAVVMSKAAEADLLVERDAGLIENRHIEESEAGQSGLIQLECLVPQRSVTR